MKIETSDALFGIQMVFMTVFVGGQFARMVHTVQGVTPTLFLCAEVFCVINLHLAYKGWKLGKTRRATQLLAVHGGWTLGIGSLIALMGAKLSEVVWGWYDTITLGLVICAVLTTGLVAARKKLTITDPTVSGTLAAIFRGVPHLCLAYSIFLLGGRGMAATTIAVGHLSVWMRMGQLYLTTRNSGWQRAHRGLALADSVNEATWIVVTIVWLWI